MSADASTRIGDLVRRARDPRASLREQHAAFATLVEHFEARAFAIALRRCDDAESARDACQEAFLLAWRKLGARWNGSCSRPAYFFCSARQASANQRAPSADSLHRPMNSPNASSGGSARLPTRATFPAASRSATSPSLSG